MTTIKERPILFSGPMVRALLDGSKTQTRRIVKLPHDNPLGKWEPTTFGGPNGGRTAKGETMPEQGAIWHTRTGDCLLCPHGQPGEHLWVRESWSAGPTNTACLEPGETHGALRHPLITYLADGSTQQCHEPLHKIAFGKGRPSIHMPRWASRITLEIFSVRAERVQDISDTDCAREGITAAHCTFAGGWKEAYSDLWETINGPNAWRANPWVWVVEFKVVKP